MVRERKRTEISEADEIARLNGIIELLQLALKNREEKLARANEMIKIHKLASIAPQEGDVNQSKLRPTLGELRTQYVGLKRQKEKAEELFKEADREVLCARAEKVLGIATGKAADDKISRTYKIAETARENMRVMQTALALMDHQVIYAENWNSDAPSDRI
jgi:hypothetical protein